MFASRLANFVLSRVDFQVLSRIATWSPLTNIPYKLVSQRLVDYSFPVHLFAESTNACNLKCSMCPRHEAKMPLGHMDPGLFQKIVDEAARYGPRNFCLHLFGEPLLARNFLVMVRMVKEAHPGNSILLTTNGVLLNEAKRAALLDAAVDKVVVSLSAADAGTYRQITGRDQFDAVVQNVRALARERDARKAGKPIIIVRGLLNPDTIHQRDDLRAIWKDAPVRVDIRMEHNYGGKIESRMSSPDEGRYPCYHLWFSPGISWDGDMSVCCCDSDRELVLGNVGQAPIADLWQGERLAELRRLHMAGRYDVIPVCRDCNVWRSYPDIFLGRQKARARREMSRTEHA